MAPCARPATVCCAKIGLRNEPTSEEDGDADEREHDRGRDAGADAVGSAFAEREAAGSFHQ